MGERTYRFKLIDASNLDEGFSVQIKNGFVSYRFLLKQPKTNRYTSQNKGLLLELNFDDGFFKDLNAAANLFMEYCQKNITSDIFKQNSISDAQKQNFLDYINEMYDKNFVVDNQIVNSVENFTLPEQNRAVSLQNATSKIQTQSNNKTDGINKMDFIVSVFGVPNGYEEDDDNRWGTIRNDREIASILQRRNQLWYNNYEKDGIELTVRKGVINKLDCIDYNFLIYTPKGGNFAAKDGRPGSFFGMNIGLINGNFFVDPKQVFDVLSNFFRKNIADKYISIKPLMYKFGSFKQTNMVEELRKYISECIDDGRLTARSASTIFYGGRSFAKAKLSDVSQKNYEDFLESRVYIQFTMKPNNTDPRLEYGNVTPGNVGEFRDR